VLCFPRDVSISFCTHYYDDVHQLLASKLEEMLQLFGAPGVSAKQVLEHVLGLSTDSVPFKLNSLLGSSFENIYYDTSDLGEMRLKCLWKLQSLDASILRIIFCEPATVAIDSYPAILEIYGENFYSNSIKALPIVSLLKCTGSTSIMTNTY